jgi:hypothetical protein
VTPVTFAPDARGYIGESEKEAKFGLALDSFLGGVLAQRDPCICTAYLDGVLLLGIPVPVAHRLVICAHRGYCCGDREVGARKNVSHDRSQTLAQRGGKGQCRFSQTGVGETADTDLWTFFVLRVHAPAFKFPFHRLRIDDYAGHPSYSPFPIGRFVSYSFWTMSSTAVSRKLELEDTDAMTYFSIYFVLTQLALLALVYTFTRVDWNLLLRERKWRWLSKSTANVRHSL